MRKNHFLALAAVLLLLLVAAGGAIFIRQRSLPVYSAGALPSSEGYGVNTLSLDNVTFISGKTEFRLQPIDRPSIPPLSAVGQAEDGAWRIYRLAGSTGDDYIYATGDMMPQVVYRNSRLAPLELRDLRVREIRLLGGSMRGTKTSQDAALIREVMASLTAGQKVTLYPDYGATDRGYRLDLLPEQMPGLYYRVDALVDRAGKVYLSTETELGQDRWVPAGDQLTRWVQG